MFILNEAGHMYSSGVNMFLRYKVECEITADVMLEGTLLCTCFLPGQKSNAIIIFIYLLVAKLIITRKLVQVMRRSCLFRTLRLSFVGWLS